MMPRFTVIASFVGECCPKPHLWSQTTRAANEKAAAAQVLGDAEGGLPRLKSTWWCRAWSRGR